MKYNKLFVFFTLLLLANQGINAQDPKYPSTIVVAKDGSGSFTSIQAAVNSVRDLGAARVTIMVKNGVYHEKLVIAPWKTNISIVGEHKDSTIISNNDFSGKEVPGGTDIYGKTTFTTFSTYTVLVQGNDCIIENITIENTAGRVGQAVALHVEADRVIIRNCKLLGDQDTLYASKENSRQFYDNCYIEGTTDFIFGEAIAVFQNCTIKNLSNSYITAASTRAAQDFGFVFLHCKLIAADAAKKVYLGRPWRPFAKTVFLYCNLGAHIVPAGWDPWKGDLMFPAKEKTALYAEYENNGPGANSSQRVAWSKQLTDTEAEQYTIANIMHGMDGWDPSK